ncbi:hypothetical protein KIN20_032849 [Parelaphostrongylus tenuis]|uniref:DZF domain-containing protein n=1 Tax=Parelaphostrongylus tenuis TaxID=148309 RepID=A0AAD5R7C2_PARTN|nr:hypothetical protein KIN20_032849 [Parelaphostrongylus tenuis]
MADRPAKRRLRLPPQSMSRRHWMRLKSMRGGGGYRGDPRNRAGFIAGPTFPVRPPPFDVHLANDVFVRINENNDTQLTQDVVTRATALTPTDSERAAVAALVLKVKTALDKVMSTPDCVPGVKFDEYREVGSMKKDTALTGHTVADIVIIMQTLPTFEAVAALGNKLAEELRAQKEVVSCVSREYGCLLAAANVQVRILITTLPSNAPNLEPDLHLAERVMMINHHALRHVVWFEEATLHSPFKVLVRVLKDIRRRHSGLQPLSVWVIEYLAHFAVMNTANRQPLPLGPAFRRVFEALATGIFLPGSPALFDPTEPGMRIGYDLSFEDMDLVCSTAQTLLRVICNGGHAAVLGTDPTKLGIDLSKEVSVWNGVAVSPLEVAYVEDCMKPKFCEADEALEHIIKT